MQQRKFEIHKCNFFISWTLYLHVNWIQAIITDAHGVHVYPHSFICEALRVCKNYH